ncbi:TPA: hypothetical protein ACOEP7_004440 [Enterobacter asburiae]|uniref:hypothetical protein n=1 Tax=Enterobacter TaxID=547 RepID=UPI001267D79D|nr:MULTISPECIES: hypothetical protein [Enterobacter]ELP5717217.1 hypothetical protein [Enterobacter asburiae]EMA4738257.1 hypothetical protein [Enterobacter asburiae]EMA4739926.1 hypothetical protein [Enterobacter asburiae]NIH88742.1 hypothetical protein [Enterobacter asburiae]WKE10269.1 hypothetical protein QOM24_05685 [Enterobacter asburiae]
MSKIGAEAQRIIITELKKSCATNCRRAGFLRYSPLNTYAQNDTFIAVDEVRQIAASFNWHPLTVAAHRTSKTPGIRHEIAGDVITLLAQDEYLSVVQ